MEKDLFTPDRKLMTDQNQDPNWSINSFVGVIYQNRHDIKTAASPKAHCTMNAPSPKPETWSTPQKFQAAHLGYRVFFLVDQLVSAISVHVNGLGFLLSSSAGLKLFFKSPYCLYMLG